MSRFDFVGGSFGISFEASGASHQILHIDKQVRTAPTNLGFLPILLRNAFLSSVTDYHALRSTCPPFAFGPISTPVPIGIPEGYSRYWVGSWDLKPK